MDILWRLADPELTATFQRYLGVFPPVDSSADVATCDVDTVQVTPGHGSTSAVNRRLQSLQHKFSNGEDCYNSKYDRIEGKCVMKDYDNNNVTTNGLVHSSVEHGKGGVVTRRNGVTATADHRRLGDTLLTDDGVLKTSNRNPFSNSTVERKACEPIILYRSLYFLFRFGAAMGAEPFYLIFYPFCCWNVDSVVVRQTCTVWAMCMYFGQATKDYVRWPRPPTPPVVRLEHAFLQESSMPSTHAMAGTAIPLVLAYQMWVRYQVSE
jgi:hypothetical protein